MNKKEKAVVNLWGLLQEVDELNNFRREDIETVDLCKKIKELILICFTVVRGLESSPSKFDDIIDIITSTKLCVWLLCSENTPGNIHFVRENYEHCLKKVHDLKKES